MTAPTITLPAPGDWVFDPARDGGRWHRVERCYSCPECEPGWVHVWCRPGNGGPLGRLRPVLTPAAGLRVWRQPASGRTEARPAPGQDEGRARGA